MSEEDKKNNELRVSIMKPFPDIRLGGRLYFETNPDVADLYGRKDTVSMKDGSTCSRNELILNSVANDRSLQKWTDIIIKIVSGDVKNKCLDILENVIGLDGFSYLSSNTQKILFVKISLDNLLEFIFKTKEGSNSTEESKILANSFIEAMDRIISIQIKVSNVFSQFYELYRNKQQG